MKKSIHHIYPLTRKPRRSWGIPVFATCVAAAAAFVIFHNDDIRLSLFSSDTAPMAQVSERSYGQSAADFVGPVNEMGQLAGLAEKDSQTKMEAEFKAPKSVALPAHNASSPRDLAAMAAAVEEEPERPGMMQAALGDGLNRLKSLPFFLPSPEEVTDTMPDDHGDATDVPLAGEQTTFDEEASFADSTDESGPVVYSANERYTYQTLEDGSQIFYSLVAKGDTAGFILNEWLGANDTASLLSAASKVNSLANIREGRPFSVELDTKGNFSRFVYEADTQNCLVVERNNDEFKARLDAIVYDTELVSVKGNIMSSLFESVGDSGEGPVLAVNMAEVFSCEINFITEIRQGDSFEVLVEKRYRDGDFKGYGNMLAARFTNQGKTYEAFLFPDASGKLRHYNAKGEALQKTLLKAPLAFTRVSSGYTMNRKHPVFGNTRPHQGVDYAAPTGTPIKAVGDGVITKSGWGNGYGNMVVIKHAGGLESQYAHMSAFAKGMKKGQKVKQGQTIGYVGATGVATGPHLDFRLKQNGKFINPTNAIVPREDPVNKKTMSLFLQAVANSKAYMDGKSALAEYKPVEWAQ